MSFLPINSRVELQAFGRTSRQGKRGTAQIIMVAKEGEHDIENIKQKRDKDEKNRIDKSIKKDLPLIQFRDDIFKRFCLLLNELRDLHKEEWKLNSVKERWALWLITNIDEETEIDNPGFFEAKEQDFNELCEEMRNECSTINICKNPVHLFRLINFQILSDSDIKTLVESLEKIISLDQTCSFVAHYHLAFAFIKKRSQDDDDEDDSNSDANYFEYLKAKNLVENARNIILNIIAQHECFLIQSKTKNGSELENQLLNKVLVFYLCKQQIEMFAKLIDSIMNERDDGLMFNGFSRLFEFFRNTDDRDEFEDSFENFETVLFDIGEFDPFWQATALNLIDNTNVIVDSIFQVFNFTGFNQMNNMLTNETLNLFTKKMIKNEIISQDDFDRKIFRILKIMTCGIDSLIDLNALTFIDLDCAQIKVFKDINKVLVQQFNQDDWIQIVKSLEKTNENNIKQFIFKLIITSDVIKKQIHECLIEAISRSNFKICIKACIFIQKQLNSEEVDVQFLQFNKNAWKHQEIFFKIAFDLIKPIFDYENKGVEEVINKYRLELIELFKNNLDKTMKGMEENYSIKKNMMKLMRINEADSNNLWDSITWVVNDDEITVKQKISIPDMLFNIDDSKEIKETKIKLYDFVNELYDFQSDTNTTDEVQETLSEIIKQLCVDYEYSIYYNLKFKMQEMIKDRWNETSRDVENALNSHINRCKSIKCMEKLAEGSIVHVNSDSKSTKLNIIAVDYDDLIEESDSNKQNEQNQYIEELISKNLQRLTDAKQTEISNITISQIAKSYNPDAYLKN